MQEFGAIAPSNPPAMAGRLIVNFTWSQVHIYLSPLTLITGALKSVSGRLP